MGVRSRSKRASNVLWTRVTDLKTDLKILIEVFLFVTTASMSEYHRQAFM